MKKNIIKIILDVILAAALILMYNANVLTLGFHEIGGLILIGAFFIHIALSPKWIATVTKKLFSKSLSARLRLNYIIDFVLLVCIAVILISGIIISKVVFAGTEDQAWRAWHYCASALALALGGVHIGLHWAFIKGMFKRAIKLPKVLGRAIGIILIAAILIYGGYSLASGSFSGWLTAPFTASLNGSGPGFGEHFGQFQNGTDEYSEGFGQFAPPEDGQLPQLPEGQTGENFPQFQGRGNGDGTGHQFGGHNGQGLGNGQGRGDGLGIHSGERSESVLGVIASYGSIAGLFAIVTAFIAKLLKKSKAAAAIPESTPKEHPVEQSDKQEG